MATEELLVPQELHGTVQLLAEGPRDGGQDGPKALMGGCAHGPRLLGVRDQGEEDVPEGLCFGVLTHSQALLQPAEGVCTADPLMYVLGTVLQRGDQRTEGSLCVHSVEAVCIRCLVEEDRQALVGHPPWGPVAKAADSGHAYDGQQAVHGLDQWGPVQRDGRAAAGGQSRLEEQDLVGVEQGQVHGGDGGLGVGLMAAKHLG
mmetsp:Transcript_11389/g.20535  ORF Transcript_11389/g.20535 Transcript_11389/m.20535 type:complete len:203 (-) Transcript_11389:2104-2712(-)